MPMVLGHEAVLTGVCAVANTARIPPGSSVAVAGLGGVGLSALLGARLAGARQIIAVALSPEKLAFARFKAPHDWEVREDLVVDSQ